MLTNAYGSGKVNERAEAEVVFHKYNTNTSLKVDSPTNIQADKTGKRFPIQNGSCANTHSFLK